MPPSRITTIAFGPLIGNPAASTAAAAVVPAGTTTVAVTAAADGADTGAPQGRSDNGRRRCYPCSSRCPPTNAPVSGVLCFPGEFDGGRGESVGGVVVLHGEDHAVGLGLAGAGGGPGADAGGEAGLVGGEVGEGVAGEDVGHRGDGVAGREGVAGVGAFVDDHVEIGAEAGAADGVGGGDVHLHGRGEVAGVGDEDALADH